MTPEKAVHVLVADDFLEWRVRIRSIVQQRPEWQVICEVCDGLQAVEKTAELRPDIVLLDVGMPILNGIEAARRMHEIVPEAKILFVTSNVDKDVADAALKNGAYGYILKADGKSELLRAINAVLRGEKVVSKRLKR